MDADDVARPERLARQVAFLDASPEVALVGAQVAFIDATGALTGERNHFPTAPKAVAAALATRGCVIRHPTIVARKPALVAAGGYRGACERAEDYDLWLRLSERTPRQPARRAARLSRPRRPDVSRNQSRPALRPRSRAARGAGATREAPRPARRRRRSAALRPAISRRLVTSKHPPLAPQRRQDSAQRLPPPIRVCSRCGSFMFATLPPCL